MVDSRVAPTPSPTPSATSTRTGTPDPTPGYTGIPVSAATRAAASTLINAAARSPTGTDTPTSPVTGGPGAGSFIGGSFWPAADALPRGIVLVHEGRSTSWPARRGPVQDVRVAMVPQLAHRQPVVRTQRDQPLTVEQPAVDQCLLARRTHSAEHAHADAVSFHASGFCASSITFYDVPHPTRSMASSAWHSRTCQQARS
jgi:hypothetical protein